MCEREREGEIHIVAPSPSDGTSTENARRTQLHLRPNHGTFSMPAHIITPTSTALLSSQTAAVSSIDFDVAHEISTLERIKTSLYNFSRSRTFRFLKGKNAI